MKAEEIVCGMGWLQFQVIFIQLDRQVAAKLCNRPPFFIGRAADAPSSSPCPSRRPHALSTTTGWSRTSGAR